MLGLGTKNRLHRVIAQFVERDDYLPTVAEQRAKKKRKRIGRILMRVIFWALLIAGGFLQGYNSRAAHAAQMPVAFAGGTPREETTPPDTTPPDRRLGKVWCAERRIVNQGTTCRVCEQRYADGRINWRSASC